MVGSLASAVAPNLVAFACAQAAIGGAAAILLSAGVAAAGEWAPAGERARVLSWTLLGQPAAWVVGMPLIGVISRATMAFWESNRPDATQAGDAYGDRALAPFRPDPQGG